MTIGLKICHTKIILNLVIREASTGIFSAGKLLLRNLLFSTVTGTKSAGKEIPRDIGGKNEAHTGENLNEVCGQKKCALELSRQGLTRARLLADWMKANGIVKKLTNVYSSHKRRTYQTVAPTAKLAGLKVQQLPKGAEELDPESNAPSVCPTINAIKDLPLGSTALVAAHTSTIYRIMDTGMKRECKGLGLDTTSNPEYFPKTKKGDLPRLKRLAGIL